MFHYLRSGKIILLLAILVILGIAMAVMHNRATEEGRPFPPEDAVRVVLKPFQSAATGIGGMFRGIGHSLRSRNAVGRENDRLKAEVKSLTTEVIRLREDAAEAKRLRSELGFKAERTEKLQPARIISRDASPWFTCATIDRGRTDGIKPAMAVITYRGFIGQIVEASPTSAQVRAINDVNDSSGSGVAAMVQRSRALGVCQGQQDPTKLQMTYLARDADIKIGDIIVTSGQGGIVPKGVPVGRVMKVKIEGGGFMKSAEIRPSARLDQSDEVFVVLGQVQ